MAWAAIVSLPWTAWHLAMLDHSGPLYHFTSLTHTQANLRLWEFEKKPFLEAPDPLQPSGSVTAMASWRRKSLLKVKVQDSSRRVAPASQGEAASLDSQTGLW